MVLQCTSVAVRESQVAFGMSALEVFVRIRQYRYRAAEFFELAAQPFTEEVRARYLAIADHYVALADAELRTDKLVRKKRLEQMRAEREKSRRTENAAGAGLKMDPPPAQREPGQCEPAKRDLAKRDLASAKLRLVKGAKQPTPREHGGRQQMAAQADFATVRSAR
jgi:hypothetical protein